MEVAPRYLSEFTLMVDKPKGWFQLLKRMLPWNFNLKSSSEDTAVIFGVCDD